MIPLSSGGRLNAVEIIQQAFNPTVSVLVSPDVDLICSKNRLTFIELLQPFSRLSVEGQIKDVNNVTYPVSQFRLSVQDISWKPASAVLAKRLMSEAVTNNIPLENRVTVKGEAGSIEINPFTPWFDSWRETLWSCLEMTEHDFSRHYLASIMVVSSSNPSPMEQFQNLNSQLLHLSSTNAAADGPRWFNSMALKYYVLLHDACEGNPSKTEEIFQQMRNAFGAHSCHLLVINSKPKKPANQNDYGLPSPDPWIRFLPRRPSKIDNASDLETGTESTGEIPDLPVKVDEGESLPSLDSVQKIQLTDALQDAMQEISGTPVLPPSASTTALSSMANSDYLPLKSSPIPSQRSTVEIKDDPLIGGLQLEAKNVHPFSDAHENIGVATNESDLEIHGGCLTTDDVDRIQHFINDFCLRSLLPHMERQMKLLNEAVSARKSTHRSLLSATKRWFGSNRPGTTQSSAAVAVSYHPESAQLQLRRLGDLAFLLGHYDLAYTSYHTAKKDFEADQAWLHYAGALEMAALSAFLQGGGRSVPFHYFDTAITTYLHTCKMTNWATRCAILASECLKSTGQYGEAALQLIRLTSEDADLRSAILLEQAALCFLRSGVKLNSSMDKVTISSKGHSNPLLRKYAFHMILAGHRFGKSGQKKHASRAYQSALQVYRGHGWSLAEDHIHYTVGRQCLNSQQIEAACQALTALLKPHSLQTPTQQTAYLTEFIHVHQMLNKQMADLQELPILPLPLVDGNKIKTLVEMKEPTSVIPPGFVEATYTTFASEEVYHNKWVTMEEKLVQNIQGMIPSTFRPTNVLFTDQTINSIQPVTYCDELVGFQIPLENPFHIPLLLCDVRLLWSFTGIDGRLSNASMWNQPENPIITTYIVPKIRLEPTSTQTVVLYIRGKAEGQIVAEGMGFEMRLANQDATRPSISVLGKVLFQIKGPRLNSNLIERQGKLYGPDKRLNIHIGPCLPKLRVLFSNLPEFILSGEIRYIRLELTNLHPQVPVTTIVVATNDPTHFVMDLPKIETEHTSENPITLYRWDLSRNFANCWMRGSDILGLKDFDLMFYYTNTSLKPRYRIVRHSSKVFVSSSLMLSGWAQHVPSLVKTRVNHAYKETLSIQVEIQNLRDIDDTSLGGIKISRISLISKDWELQPEESNIPEVVLHPQENMMCSLRAVYTAEKSGLLSEAAATEKENKISPFTLFIREFERSETSAVIVATWTANQASDDGSNTFSTEGQLFAKVRFSSLVPLRAEKPLEGSHPLISYSIDYSSKVVHNFHRQRLCIIPVNLHLHNCVYDTVQVQYLANMNQGKSNQATQLYMPEAAAPLIWLGKVQGLVVMKGHTSETVPLTVAVSRPGVYSLAHALQISSSILGTTLVIQSTKLEFTLVVENSNL